MIAYFVFLDKEIDTKRSIKVEALMTNIFIWNIVIDYRCVTCSHCFVYNLDDPRAKIFVGNLDWKTKEGKNLTILIINNDIIIFVAFCMGIM